MSSKKYFDIKLPRDSYELFRFRMYAWQSLVLSLGMNGKPVKRIIVK